MKPTKIESVKGPGENNIIVSTYQTFSTGINVKRLHHIIFFSSYKSKIKILQSIGRGLRTHSTKEHMTLWDIVDDLRYTYQGKKVDNYIYRHWKSRKSYYDEQGFGHETISMSLPENPKYIRGE
jgi:type I site-specific restriction endonuclease